MQIVPIKDSLTWDRALLTLPNPHVLQSWAWGELKSRYGWQATRLLFQEGGRTVAAASVLRRQVSRLPVVACYVPKDRSLIGLTPTWLAGSCKNLKPSIVSSGRHSSKSILTSITLMLPLLFPLALPVPPRWTNC